MWRGTAVGNPTGELAVYPVYQYSSDTQATILYWEVLNLKTGKERELKLRATEVTEIVWIPGSSIGIIYLNNSNPDIAGGKTLWIGGITKPRKARLVASLDAP